MLTQWRVFHGKGKERKAKKRRGLQSQGEKKKKAAVIMRPRAHSNRKKRGELLEQERETATEMPRRSTEVASEHKS